MVEKTRAVVAVVIYEDKVLLGKKKAGGGATMSGKWHILGETLNIDETDGQGLVRGILEEAGIQIRPGKYLGSHMTPKDRKVNWYECEPLSTGIIAGSDLEEVRWVPFGEVQKVCHENAISLWPVEIQDYFNNSEKG